MLNLAIPNNSEVSMRYRKAFSRIKLRIVLLLLQKGTTPLIEAAMRGYTDTVKELLSLGASVDLADWVSALKRVPLPCSGYGLSLENVCKSICSNF